MKQVIKVMGLFSFLLISSSLSFAQAEPGPIVASGNCKRQVWLASRTRVESLRQYHWHSGPVPQMFKEETKFWSKDSVRQIFNYNAISLMGHATQCAALIETNVNVKEIAPDGLSISDCDVVDTKVVMKQCKQENESFHPLLVPTN